MGSTACRAGCKGKSDGPAPRFASVEPGNHEVGFPRRRNDFGGDEKRLTAICRWPTLERFLPLKIRAETLEVLSQQVGEWSGYRSQASSCGPICRHPCSAVVARNGADVGANYLSATLPSRKRRRGGQRFPPFPPGNRPGRHRSPVCRTRPACPIRPDLDVPAGSLPGKRGPG